MIEILEGDEPKDMSEPLPDLELSRTGQVARLFTLYDAQKKNLAGVCKKVGALKCGIIGSDDSRDTTFIWCATRNVIYVMNDLGNITHSFHQSAYATWKNIRGKSSPVLTPQEVRESVISSEEILHFCDEISKRLTPSFGEERRVELGFITRGKGDSLRVLLHGGGLDDGLYKYSHIPTKSGYMSALVSLSNDEFASEVISPLKGDDYNVQLMGIAAQTWARDIGLG